MLYLDESGNHDLRRAKINPNYPVFALAGIVVDRAYERTVIAPQMRDFKIQYLGDEEIVLHTTDMHRLQPGFEVLKDRAFRLRFYEALNDLIASWDFKVIACGIKLFDHLDRYGERARDPYYYSLGVIVERFCRELEGAPDEGFICAEMRNPGLDRELKTVWDDIRRNGTDFATAAELDEKIVHLTLKDKKPNIAGMQLADLVATPVGRGILRLDTKPDEVSRAVVKSKLRREGGQHRGYDVVELPSF